MKIIKTPPLLHAWRRSVPQKKTVGFVPTMGALHEGHLSLMSRMKNENDVAVASIFVNPAQFRPGEDLSRYPRPFEKDVKLLKKIGVQILFAPEPKSMYPSDHMTRVTVPPLSGVLCGSPQSRGPEHFAGVAVVVAKLFNLVRPARAYFGMKDFQQLRIIEQMAKDLNFDLKIVRCPTKRDKDGLALSSRNTYLAPEERKIAPQFHLALQQGAKLLRSGGLMKPLDIIQRIKSDLVSHPKFKIDYIEMVNPETLLPVPDVKGPILLAGAVWLGKTRLIDNILVN